MGRQRSSRRTGKIPETTSPPPDPTLDSGMVAHLWPGVSLAPEDLHPTGIEVIGAVPWGTHFCQFYATPQDLIEILVPYFRAGLAANEFCMWVTSLPLQADQAQAALQAAVPDLEEYLAKGQIEILDYSQWYTRGGHFDADLVLQGWTDKLVDARSRGFAGLRLTGNTFWLEDAQWEDFTRYEAKVNEVIGSQRMIALCTYSLEKCGAREVLDVVANHQFALIKSRGRWEIIESAKHKKTEQALRESEARYRNLFEGMTEGFGLHEIVCDEAGNPCDYRFLDINPAFEQLTGLKRENVVGKTLRQVLPGDDPKWVEVYGQVALTGEPIHFENFSPGLNRYYRIFAYRPAPRQFAVIFMDVTEQKNAEQALLENQARVEVQHRLLEQREQERQKIARDLHDGPVQMLTAASFTVQTLAVDWEDEATRDQYADLQEMINKAIAELRAFAGDLRPPSLVKFGLGTAILSYAEGFNEKHPGLHISVEKTGDDHLSMEIRLGVFRIFQESLNNVLKHARATTVRVGLEITPQRVQLEIKDNGSGFEVPGDWLEMARAGHLGLVGMRERAEAMGGGLEIQSHPGAGTTIRAIAPLK